MSDPAKVHVPFRLVPCADGRFEICWEQLPVLRFCSQRMLAEIGETARQHFALPDILRWGAPFALAERGLILLHAACAAYRDRAVALMAPGGTGKSSLGRVLHDAGWASIADDALLCDAEGRVGACPETSLRAWCAEQSPKVEKSGWVDYGTLADSLIALRENGENAHLHLRAIAFLRLPRTCDGLFASVRVDPVSGFHELAQHSFGAAPDSVAWTHEARVYGGLASAVPLWSVHAPEGLEAMRDALPQWLAAIVPEAGVAADAADASHLSAANT